MAQPTKLGQHGLVITTDDNVFVGLAAGSPEEIVGADRWADQACMVHLGHADESGMSTVRHDHQLDGMWDADLDELVAVLTTRHCCSLQDKCSC